MELKDLVGEHMLDAVDFNNEQIEAYYGKGFDQAQVMIFRLDGKVYSAIENPDDGYRSTMRDLLISDLPMKNTFEPTRVFGRYIETEDLSGYDSKNGILELLDFSSGDIVIRVGTDTSDNYYPMFIADFFPEQMSNNRSTHGESTSD